MDCIDIYDHDCNTYNFALDIHKIQFEEIQYHEINVQYARVIAIIVVGYAFSPIDLIPDPIPVFGYLDDLILIPLGIALVIKMVPADVLNECREKARERLIESKPKNWVAACVIILIWILLFVIIGYYCIQFFKNY